MMKPTPNPMDASFPIFAQVLNNINLPINLKVWASTLRYEALQLLMSEIESNTASKKQSRVDVICKGYARYIAEHEVIDNVQTRCEVMIGYMEDVMHLSYLEAVKTNAGNMNHTTFYNIIRDEISYRAGLQKGASQARGSASGAMED